MKKLTALLCATALIITASSCLHRNHSTSITYNESDHYYDMYASYGWNKTDAVDRYLTRMLGRRNVSYHSRINGTIALDDHTIFYIKKYPGILRIKFNKDENSYEAYENIKDMCEGIKDVLVDERR